jgi:hypothetical protein
MQPWRINRSNIQRYKELSPNYIRKHFMPRIKLSEQYHDEREELCKKLIEIVGTEFLLSELDENVEKQTAILSLKDEIQKCFACSEISSFKANFECKRPYLNIVRGILRKQGYKFIGSAIVLKMENGESKSTKKYNIFSNN